MFSGGGGVFCEGGVMEGILSLISWIVKITIISF